MSNLAVTELDNVLVVDSRLIAEDLNIEHESFMRTIKKHEAHIESRFGILRFEIGEIIGRGQPEKYAFLTEPQATLLMALSKNTSRVVDCKFALVEAFEKAKKVIKEVIPAQALELEKLRLENENLRLRVQAAEAEQRATNASDSLLRTRQAIATLHNESEYTGVSSNRTENTAIAQHCLKQK